MKYFIHPELKQALKNTPKTRRVLFFSFVLPLGLLMSALAIYLGKYTYSLLMF